jgi:fatty-acyl-CoA synthase
VPEFPLTSAYWPADTSAPLLETTIGSILRDAATRAPDKVALIDGVDSGGDGAGDDGGRRRRRWTYVELRTEAERAARALLTVFAPGEQLLYTSGTTGRPKGALLTHRALTNNARLAFRTAGIGPDDILVNPMPMFHVGGGLFTFGAVSAVATQVLMPRFSPALQLELIEKYRATALLGVPTMMNAIMGQLDGQGWRDVSSLRVAISGGAVSPPALVRRIESELGLRYSISLAQTEASCSITMASAADSADDRAETLGRPLPHSEVRIVDLRTGRTAACGAIGEICARGYQVMRGYLDAPAATAAAIDPDGWLRTGDLGSMDERGYLRIAGRIKDMIIRGGENIYPREIEEVLISHPAVAEAAVLGFPDDHYGEVVAAAIRPSPPAAAPSAASAAGRHPATAA